MDTLALLRAGNLAGTQRLNLACGLTEFPPEIFELADTLEILDLSGNAFSSLPDDFGRLHKLRVLFCSNNQFTELPAVLGQCPQLSMIGFKANQIRHVPAAALTPALRWLILTDNQISELPAELGLCTRLQKLMLAGNRLTALPESLVACTRLELLRIAANQFTALPDWLFSLPCLSWLAYAGNPLCEHNETAALTQNPIPHIDWASLSLRQQLGEGASGVIHQAAWQPSAEQHDVAVKLFKGALTSDGLPLSEMAACISAGAHPGLINVHGKIHDHPENAIGLVMALVDPEFRNLAGPPSLDSCTRDVYAADTRFSLDTVLRIAHSIASAAQHLHARGIMHGDLYAHNILHNDAGKSLLGDFGAASFVADSGRAQALERIEVRAFACLLEELLTRCDTPDAALQGLQQRCAHTDSAMRPLFTEISQTLIALQTLAVA
ncbi:leucine-rich repeat-containing protein kinase family protein [Sulfuriferula thiophila]|uniref:leucine-rich repeat-containing protein kinase family protein n=1 Tax=Sulfuriferula thiophila TaxID=1781211 RepID=UPI000F612DD1|nr:leucine-rich repeat-containing protein kinase family protein [Sulfuriferula thiophila]